MRKLVLDAGPLIAFFDAKDTDHSTCKAGFVQLFELGTTLIVPVPIIFEVYKWFLHKSNTVIAKTVLVQVRSTLTPMLLSQQDIETIYASVEATPNWAGSLEDATIICAAQHHRCPVWTLNYRDFGIFKSLEFWNPES